MKQNFACFGFACVCGTHFTGPLAVGASLDCTPRLAILSSSVSTPAGGGGTAAAPSAAPSPAGSAAGCTSAAASGSCKSWAAKSSVSVGNSLGGRAAAARSRAGTPGGRSLSVAGVVGRLPPLEPPPGSASGASCGVFRLGVISVSAGRGAATTGEVASGSKRSRLLLRLRDCRGGVPAPSTGVLAPRAKPSPGAGAAVPSKPSRTRPAELGGCPARALGVRLLPPEGSRGNSVGALGSAGGGGSGLSEGSRSAIGAKSTPADPPL